MSHEDPLTCRRVLLPTGNLLSLLQLSVWDKLQDKVSQPYTITILGGIIFVSGAAPCCSRDGRIAGLSLDISRTPSVMTIKNVSRYC